MLVCEGWSLYQYIVYKTSVTLVSGALDHVRFTDATKILDQLVLEILFVYLCLVLSLLHCIVIVLYRETEDEIYRIKESK